MFYSLPLTKLYNRNSKDKEKGSPSEVVNVMNVVSEFDIQSCCYIQIGLIALGKVQVSLSF